ncbi:flagellar/basal body protein [Dunaliella salina]|uniref:Cilia- and flagella-associated protein 300 n=1 Tax=Dunaliella salina TaxID=3046 RepID=A0ABQ7GJV0_DUNSA|nr:flagellar/basal body protein [Dunaliella salina]|eukprot:KAF5834885.1 flagellar/basal body protein [Dunaliella salina]
MGFQHVQLPKCAFNEPWMKSLLKKWDLSRGLQFLAFRFTKFYHRMAGSEMALDLFNDPVFQSTFKIMTADGWAPLAGHKVVHVDLENVPATLTRMDLFDKVAGEVPAEAGGPDPPIVRSVGGHILQRMDDVRDGIPVNDNLREMLLCEESDNAGLYSEDEMSELLWRCFEHLSLGGPCCQNEDKLEPYLEAAKRLYKELVSVQRSGEGGLEVASTVFRIKGIRAEREGGGSVPLFPRKANLRNSFCYITMDPNTRLIRLLYHAFIPYW